MERLRRGQTARNREHGQVAAAILLLQVEGVLNLEPLLLDRILRIAGFQIGLGFNRRVPPNMFCCKSSATAICKLGGSPVSYGEMERFSSTERSRRRQTTASKCSLKLAEWIDLNRKDRSGDVSTVTPGMCPHPTQPATRGRVRARFDVK